MPKDGGLRREYPLSRDELLDYFARYARRSPKVNFESPAPSGHRHEAALRELA
jgi:hypothetical protein